MDLDRRVHPLRIPQSNRPGLEIVANRQAGLLAYVSQLTFDVLKRRSTKTNQTGEALQWLCSTARLVGPVPSLAGHVIDEAVIIGVLDEPLAIAVVDVQVDAGGSGSGFRPEELLGDRFEQTFAISYRSQPALGDTSIAQAVQVHHWRAGRGGVVAAGSIEMSPEVASVS